MEEGVQHSKPDVWGKKVVVLGLGISGLWTARWLAGQGARVTVSEIKSRSEIQPEIFKEMGEIGISLETGGHRRETLLDAQMIVLSPGVPQDMEGLRDARGRGIAVTGELELASRLIDSPIIAVTGTNGKSTVTAFLGFLLKRAGFKVFVGGNIGTPLMAYAAGERKDDYLVVEVSSFQLDTAETFCPFLSIILNISPDHLDRYPDYPSYVRSKLGILKNQRQGQFAVFNDDDKTLASVELKQRVSLLRYGMEKREGRNAFVEGSKVRTWLETTGSHAFSLESFRLPGRHNVENLMAVILGGLALGVAPSVIQESVHAFKGLPNRLELVSQIKGVSVYNDSKATNVDAAVRALESFDRPIVLIAGGRHKGADYSPLVEAGRGKVKSAVFLGEARGLLRASFEGRIPFSEARDMDEAVSLAYSKAKPGDVILLAPACSSFDMFSDYAHRGAAFKAAVERLIHE